MTILIGGILAIFLTFGFDFIMNKVEEKREIDIAWKALNEQLERKGKQRWDKR